MRQISLRLLIAILTLTIGVVASAVFTLSVRQTYIQNVLNLEAVETTTDSTDVPFNVEPQICAVHDAAMQHDRVPIHYGLPYIPMRYFENRERLFQTRINPLWAAVRSANRLMPKYIIVRRAAKLKWRGGEITTQLIGNRVTVP